MYADHTQLNIQKGAFADLQPFLHAPLSSLVCYPMNSNHLGFPKLLGSILSTQGDDQIFPDSSVLWYGLKILFRQQSRTAIGLASFVPCLPGITDLHCLMSNVFSTIVYLVYQLFQMGGANLVSVYSIFIRNGSSDVSLKLHRNRTKRMWVYRNLF